MKGIVQIAMFLSGVLTILGIYAWLEYSRGVAKSEIKRANEIVRAIKDNKHRPNLTYWLNLYYLELIRNFRFFIGAAGILFLLSIAAAYFM